MPTAESSNSSSVSLLLNARRQFLGAGAMGALGLLWSDWLCASQSNNSGDSQARSVILIFNSGAPSHLDLWDMKPDAPDNIRGQFRPISTNVPGIHVSELMPHVAQQADKYSIIRTLHHRHTQHNSGMHWSIVGRPYRIDSTLINPGSTDVPSFGTLVGWLAQRDGYSSPLPPYVITPSPHCDSSAYITPGQFGGCLGGRYDPFVLNRDPNAPDFHVPNIGLSDGVTAERFTHRQNLLQNMNGVASPISQTVSHNFDFNHSRAFTLVTSEEFRQAFDLSREPDSVRNRYGRHSWGQSHLLARRLVEAGVPFVTTVNGPSIVWDTHEDNVPRLRDRLVPPMERAFSALLDDLDDRGLLDSTLVVWLGDFGRTPIINNKGGRDHWPQCYSAVMAGGGIRGGQVIGESDRFGAYPSIMPIEPADVHATVFTALGYDPHAITYQSAEGRPFPLSEGQVIRGLL